MNHTDVQQLDLADKRKRFNTDHEYPEDENITDREYPKDYNITDRKYPEDENIALSNGGFTT